MISIVKPEHILNVKRGQRHPTFDLFRLIT